MRVTHLVLPQPAATELVDEVTARQTMVDHGSIAAQRTHTERHVGQGYRGNRSPVIHRATGSAGHTVGMNFWYGANVADEAELRLCGDIAGKRVIELGIAATPNSIAAATAGAKAIALDPDPQAITALRAAAERHEVRIECHQGDLADLGFATSASVDLVIASHSLAGVDDLSRLLRQVHRVLKPGANFIVAMPHPVAAMFGPDHQLHYAYGATSLTFGGLLMTFERTNFHLDAVHELNDRRHRDAAYPSVVVMRAKKQGV